MFHHFKISVPKHRKWHVHSEQIATTKTKPGNLERPTFVFGTWSGGFKAKLLGGHGHFERAHVSHQKYSSTFWLLKHCFFIHVLPILLCPSPCLVGEISLRFFASIRGNSGGIPNFRKQKNETHPLIGAFYMIWSLRAMGFSRFLGAASPHALPSSHLSQGVKSFSPGPAGCASMKVQASPCSPWPSPNQISTWVNKP